MRRAGYLNSKMVLKDDYIGLNCLVGCINIFLIFYLLYQNVTKFCAFCWKIWDSKSCYIEEFKTFCAPEREIPSIFTYSVNTLISPIAFQ